MPLDGFRVLLEDAVAIVRVQRAAPEPRRRQPLGDRIAEQRLDLRADVRQPVRVFGVHHERQAFDEPATVLLVAPQPQPGDADADCDQGERRETADHECRRDVDAP
jgi:hypothetical protein